MNLFFQDNFRFQWRQNNSERIIGFEWGPKRNIKAIYLHDHPLDLHHWKIYLVDTKLKQYPFVVTKIYSNTKKKKDLCVEGFINQPIIPLSQFTQVKYCGVYFKCETIKLNQTGYFKVNIYISYRRFIYDTRDKLNFNSQLGTIIYSYLDPNDIDYWNITTNFQLKNHLLRFAKETKDAKRSISLMSSLMNQFPEACHNIIGNILVKNQNLIQCEEIANWILKNRRRDFAINELFSTFTNFYYIDSIRFSPSSSVVFKCFIQNNRFIKKYIADAYSTRFDQFSKQDQEFILQYVFDGKKRKHWNC